VPDSGLLYGSKKKWSHDSRRDFSLIENYDRSDLFAVIVLIHLSATPTSGPSSSLVEDYYTGTPSRLTIDLFWTDRRHLRKVECGFFRPQTSSGIAGACGKQQGTGRREVLAFNAGIEGPRTRALGHAQKLTVAGAIFEHHEVGDERDAAALSEVKLESASIFQVITGARRGRVVKCDDESLDWIAKRGGAQAACARPKHTFSVGSAHVL